MADRKTIVDKIKKCLNLSTSSNEHEAAAALRQAAKLMELYGISDLDIQAANASERRTRSGASKAPSNWETALAMEVAGAFSCQVIFSSHWTLGEWVFIGTGAAPEIAEYAFKVLLRQCKHSRAEYIKSRLKRCKPGAKVRRADLYCEGWVAAVAGVVTRFSSGEVNRFAVDAYLEKNYPTLANLKSLDRNSGRNLRDHDYDDIDYGRRAGKDARLNRGIGGMDERKALQ